MWKPWKIHLRRNSDVKDALVNRYSVYKNGSELIGVASEQDLPEITFLTDTIEGAGVGGNMDYSGSWTD